MFHLSIFLAYLDFILLLFFKFGLDRYWYSYVAFKEKSQTAAPYIQTDRVQKTKLFGTHFGVTNLVYYLLYPASPIGKV